VLVAQRKRMDEVGQTRHYSEGPSERAFQIIIWLQSRNDKLLLRVARDNRIHTHQLNDEFPATAAITRNEKVSSHPL
jgi:hypothetical protein